MRQLQAGTSCHASDILSGKRAGPRANLGADDSQLWGTENLTRNLDGDTSRYIRGEGAHHAERNRDRR